MSEIPYKNVMARQLNGPVIQSLLRSAHDSFDEKGQELIEHRSNFSLSSATTEELELLGQACGIDRPYVVIEGETVSATDEEYKTFFSNIMTLRQSRSLVDLANVFYQFIPDGEFDLEISKTTGDIRVVVSDRYSSYLPFLAQAGNFIFNASPRLLPFELRNYFRFVWNGVLYLRYIDLAQPNFWTFDYDDSTHSLDILSEDSSALVEETPGHWAWTVTTDEDTSEADDTLSAVQFASGEKISVIDSGRGQENGVATLNSIGQVEQEFNVTYASEIPVSASYENLLMLMYLTLTIPY